MLTGINIIYNYNFLGQYIDIYLSGLLARRQNAWSQDGGNMRVIANGVNR